MAGKKGSYWREVSPCGTAAAYYRHLKHGEEPCPEDRAAVAAQQLESRHAREQAARDAQVQASEDHLKLIRGQADPVPCSCPIGETHYAE